MTKIAILPLKEIKSCSECPYSWGIWKSESGKYREFECKLFLEPYWGTLKEKELNGHTINDTHAECPLISIDIQELEEAVEYTIHTGNEWVLNHPNEPYVKITQSNYNTIKSKISKLKGVK